MFYPIQQQFKTYPGNHFNTTAYRGNKALYFAAKRDVLKPDEFLNSKQGISGWARWPMLVAGTCLGISGLLGIKGNSLIADHLCDKSQPVSQCTPYKAGTTTQEYLDQFGWFIAKFAGIVLTLGAIPRYIPENIPTFTLGQSLGIPASAWLAFEQSPEVGSAFMMATAIYLLGVRNLLNNQRVLAKSKKERDKDLWKVRQVDIRAVCDSVQQALLPPLDLEKHKKAGMMLYVAGALTAQDYKDLLSLTPALEVSRAVRQKGWYKEPQGGFAGVGAQLVLAGALYSFIHPEIGGAVASIGTLCGFLPTLLKIIPQIPDKDAIRTIISLPVVAFNRGIGLIGLSDPDLRNLSAASDEFASVTWANNAAKNSWKMRFIERVIEQTLDRFRKDPQLTTNDLRAQLGLLKGTQPTEMGQFILEKLDHSGRRRLKSEIRRIEEEFTEYSVPSELKDMPQMQAIVDHQFPLSLEMFREKLGVIDWIRREDELKNQFALQREVFSYMELERKENPYKSLKEELLATFDVLDFASSALAQNHEMLRLLEVLDTLDMVKTSSLYAMFSDLLFHSTIVVNGWVKALLDNEGLTKQLGLQAVEELKSKFNRWGQLTAELREIYPPQYARVPNREEIESTVHGFIENYD